MVTIKLTGIPGESGLNPNLTDYKAKFTATGVGSPTVTTPGGTFSDTVAIKLTAEPCRTMRRPPRTRQRSQSKRMSSLVATGLFPKPKLLVDR